MPKKIKLERVKVLNEIKKISKKEFIEKNENLEILIEEEKDGTFFGYSKNYIKCKLYGDFKVGDIVKARIVKPHLDVYLSEKI